MLYGCSAEEAEDKAISDMGDATKLMRELAEVHSFFPLKRFKNSLVLFAVGFIMVSLYIDVGIFDEVCAVVGNTAMLVACFNLAGCNRLLFAAFALSVAGYAAMTAGWAISSFPYSAEGAALNVAVIIVGVIISCIRMYVFGYGIAQFSQGKAAERARRIGWIYLFACALICVTCFVPDIIWLTFAALVVVVIVIAFAIANSASVPAVFVDLCSVGGRVLRIENNYEYFSSERIGVENSFIDGSSDRSGYALFDVGLNGAEGFYFTEQRYVNSRILRRP